MARRPICAVGLVKEKRFMRVLLVEDDGMIGSSLRSGLASQGMAVDWVQNAGDAEDSFRSSVYALVLLDLGLPDSSGLEVLKKIRTAKNKTPILIVTARDDLPSKIAGLDLGADDYIIKPFDFSELMARIRAVIRRQAGHSASKIECGEVLLDMASHEASYRRTRHVLPAREFALLLSLAERAGTILSRSQLEERLYGSGEEVESNAVDVLIFYIRKKFGHDIIRNVRGAGWLIPKDRP
jgi:DNA-binding response OmpR family regulator